MYALLTNCFAGHTVQFRESVVVGRTQLDAAEVQELVHALGSEFRGNTYHLLERNCNHFSDELVLRLTGRRAPLWVCPYLVQKACGTSAQVVTDAPKLGVCYYIDATGYLCRVP